MINRGRFRLAAVAAATALLLTACADDDDDGDADDAGDSDNSTCEVTVSEDTAAKPEVTVPDCDPPAELVTDTVVAGDGEEAAGGATVLVQYVGISWSTREQFDASWDRGGEPFPVAPLGQAQVITGWNEGLVGAQPGERRLLVIPPEMGYGPQGSPPAIAPNETLVFVVDVVSVEQAQ